MKDVGIIIDLYQPPTQEESILKQAVNDLYAPLIRLIKSNKNIKFSLSIPLSTLELLDKHGYGEIINDIKDLYSSEKIELVGSSAYNALLTDMPVEVVENQIILNEYALGYYFGARQGFEGEPSIMIKDLYGLVPTMLVINDEVLTTLGELGYKWVIAADFCIPFKYRQEGLCMYKVKGCETGILKLDSKLNNIINGYYKDDIQLTCKRVIEEISSKDNKHSIIYVSGLERFGDKEIYKKEFNLIDVLTEGLIGKNIMITSIENITKDLSVSEIDEKLSVGYDTKEESSLKDSFVSVILYLESEDKRLAALKKIEKNLIKTAVKIDDKNDLQDLLTEPIWKDERLTTINNVLLHNKLYHYVLLSKLASFSKYSCLSNILLNSEQNSYDKIQLAKFIQLAVKCADLIESDTALSLREDIDKFLSLI